MRSRDAKETEGRKEFPVRLVILGEQTDEDGQMQTTKSAYDARCVQRQDGYCFYYQLPEEDCGAKLFVSRSLVYIRRENGAHTCMCFDLSLPFTDCLYETPFGAVPIRISTGHIAVLDGGKQGQALPPAVFHRGPSETGPHTDNKVSARSEAAAENIHVRARIKYTLTMEPGIIRQCKVDITARGVPDFL